MTHDPPSISMRDLRRRGKSAFALEREFARRGHPAHGVPARQSGAASDTFMMCG
ncbi:MAG: hypothetical protein K8S97_06875 [Anaerolineae bacterium]|nr:hypothetical protein [Anaerolineae bacterium]